jgi:hypothetical protein
VEERLKSIRRLMADIERQERELTRLKERATELIRESGPVKPLAKPKHARRQEDPQDTKDR